MDVRCLVHLSHTAAFLMPILIEREHPLLSDQVHGLLSVWECVLYADAVSLLHIIKQLVGLWI